MSDKAQQQRKEAAQRLKNLVQKSKSDELEGELLTHEEDEPLMGGEQEEDELVYFIDSKPSETNKKPRKGGRGGKKKQEKPKEEPEEKEEKIKEEKELPELTEQFKGSKDMEEKINVLLEHVYALQEEKKNRVKAKEAKKQIKEQKEKMFRQMSEDYLERHAKKQYYNTLLSDKQRALFDAVKF